MLEENVVARVQQHCHGPLEVFSMLKQLQAVIEFGMHATGAANQTRLPRVKPRRLKRASWTLSAPLSKLF